MTAKKQKDGNGTPLEVLSWLTLRGEIIESGRPLTPGSDAFERLNY